MLQFANAEEDRNKIVSALAPLEAHSGIRRLHRGRLLTSDQTSVAIASLAAEMRRVIEQPVSTHVVEMANLLIDRHYLRALDAIQLASAMVSREAIGDLEMRFISSDIRLLNASQAEGFTPWNPIPQLDG